MVGDNNASTTQQSTVSDKPVLCQSPKTLPHMGCSESKDEIQLQDNYRRQLKNDSVLAAMESLQIDFRDTGLRYYRVFAAMDADGSHSIDLEEFHTYFGIPRSRLSDQVFSALGHQSASRDVTFDDFVLNLWNFCTMSREDVVNHVFHLYDDDHSGTLDAAECDSLFRLLYNTSELPPEIQRIIGEVDANADGLLDKDEFATLCSKHTALLQPVYQLQQRARQKCIGISYWKKEEKKRAKILNGQPSVFALAKARKSQRTQEISPVASTPVQAQEVPSDQSKPAERKASERIALRQQQQELESLEAWIHEQEREFPLVDQYWKAYCERHIMMTHLAMTRTSNQSRESVQLLTDLRHHLAIAEKRYDEAKSRLQTAWDAEEAAARNTKHEGIRTTMNALSPKVMLKNVGRENSQSAVGSYLQKKLDAVTNELHDEFQRRWDKLDRAAALLGDRALAAAAPPSQRMAERRQRDSQRGLAATKTTPKILPVEAPLETWTEYFDTTHQRAYYISSLGHSSWDKPDGAIHAP